MAERLAGGQSASKPTAPGRRSVVRIVPRVGNPHDVSSTCSCRTTEWISPFVESVARELRRQGLEPWLDRWYLVPGREWMDDLPAALEASSNCAVFIGKHGLGDWEQLELKLAEQRATRDRGFGLIPVLLPGLPEPFEPSAVLPPFLSTRTWVDLRQGIGNPARLEPLVRAIKGIAQGPVAESSHAEGPPPYRGLDRFEEEHADLFFGRAPDVQRLLEKLKVSRFLAVVAPSGCGKSSLVRAGLLPAIRAGELSDSETCAPHTAGAGENALSNGDTRAVRVGDGVNVNAGGRAHLQFIDAIELLLFHDTVLHVELVSIGAPASGNPLFTRVVVGAGTLFGPGISAEGVVKQKHVQITTPNGVTIEPIGTEFLVYYDPDADTTWVVVRQGQVRVTAADVTLDVQQGTQTWAQADQPPQPAVPATRPDVGDQFPNIDDLTDGTIGEDYMLGPTPMANPGAGSGPEPPITPTPTPSMPITPTPTPTPSPVNATDNTCAPLTDLKLSASSRQSTMDVTWAVSGGCEPYTGTITAEYAYADFSRDFSVTSKTGTWSDTAPAGRCGTDNSIHYSLMLHDMSGQQAAVDTTAQAEVVCPTPVTRTPAPTPTTAPTSTPTLSPTPTLTPTPTPVPCSMTVTSFNVNPRADRSAVVLDWATRSTGDCKAVVGRLDELYENSPPGNYQLYHTHPVGFSGSQHVDPYPPRRCGGIYKVDFFLAFQNPNGSSVATAIRTVPFTWPPCAVP